MRVRGGRGTVRIRLEEIEAELLRALLDDLAQVVEEDAFEDGDPVRQRLFPAGYGDDVAASDDFRELTESSLRIERAQRARDCAAEVEGAGELVLDAEAAERWLRVLNDLRLALGTRLHITEDNHPDEIDEAHPQAQEWTVYYWLTGLQDGIVRSL